MVFSGIWIMAGLLLVMGLVLVLPFFSKKVEEELEAFLFVMGLISVTVSGLWSKTILHEALVEPIKISAAVLLAGILFKYLRPFLKKWVQGLADRFGLGLIFFLLVSGLGFLSSMITAIIAALVLAEVMTILKLERKFEIRLVVMACFAIGLGAVLTPLGEPLATIAVAKLRGEPYHANFTFLLRLMSGWVLPLVLGLGIWAASMKAVRRQAPLDTLKEDRPENLKDVVLRALKVYLFVMALVLLGTGFKPIIDQYLIHVPGEVLYWINIVSAVLDNATLTAAEISPAMPLSTIRDLLLGLLIAGGMLIPGNIPNIICANKLSIRSAEWAKVGIPLGIGLMIIGFMGILIFK